MIMMNSLYHSADGLSRKQCGMRGECAMKKKPWIDETGACRCESCGKKVPQEALFWERGLGYCKACFREIEQERKKRHSDS